MFISSTAQYITYQALFITSFTQHTGSIRNTGSKTSKESIQKINFPEPTITELKEDCGIDVGPVI